MRATHDILYLMGHVKASSDPRVMDRDNSSGERQRASANRTCWGSSSLEAVAAMLPPSADIYILCVLAIVSLFSKKTFFRVMDGQSKLEICAVPP